MKTRSAPPALVLGLAIGLGLGLALGGAPAAATALTQQPATSSEAKAELERRGVEFDDSMFVLRASEGDDEAIDLFLAAGVSPNARWSSGETALFNAAE